MRNSAVGISVRPPSGAREEEPMHKKLKVDVYNVHGKRVYIGMVDDPALPYLHWGDGYGFVDRLLVEARHYELREVGR